MNVFCISVGQKCLGTSCPQRRSNGRPCRGKLCDFVLDWEAELPDNDLDLSNAHSTLADLSVVIGSTLQVSLRKLSFPILLRLFIDNFWARVKKLF